MTLKLSPIPFAISLAARCRHDISSDLKASLMSQELQHAASSRDPAENDG